MPSVWWGASTGGRTDPNTARFIGSVLLIDSPISNYYGKKVGLRINERASDPGTVATWPWHGNYFVMLRGNQSNTFTGETVITNSTILYLSKYNEDGALSGNVVVKKGSTLAWGRGNQIVNTSTVTLDGRVRAANLSFDPIYYNMSETFHRLVVKGEGALYFTGSFSGYTRELFLDDLWIEQGSSFEITYWLDGVTRLLVRKDSLHLHESLNRMRFTGSPSEWHGGLRAYNKDYWEIIPALPEPAVYGAASAAVMLALVFWRKRKAKGKSN